MSVKLSPLQCEALLDLLSHGDTYDQIRCLRIPGSLEGFGPPFPSSLCLGSASSSTSLSQSSTLPALQTLLQKFIVNIATSLRDLRPEFWSVEVRGLVGGFQDANLSEGVDKGRSEKGIKVEVKGVGGLDGKDIGVGDGIGNRKIVAIAAGVGLEYVVRGVFGGMRQKEKREEGMNGNGERRKEYDLGKAEDLERAWEDVCYEVVWGRGLDGIFEELVKADRLEEFEGVFQAAAEYLTVNIASILHYTFIVSPQGQYLLGLMENSIKMMPWGLIKQTLKIGNAATMMSALMKVLLAKVSVGSLTNMVGLTSGRDEGMNLNQRILASTLGGDIKDFETKAHRIEKEKILTKEQMQCLREYTKKSREEQEEIREQSRYLSISIIQSIFKSSSLPANLLPTTHTAASNYLSHHLSIRDRREIVRVLCRSNPDHLTSVLRTCIEVMDPVIRRTHKAVDLSSSIGDLEAFLKDLIQVAKIYDPKGNGKEPPSVSDFVQLLKIHRSSLLRFYHQALSNDKELRGLVLEITREWVGEFKDGENSNPSGDVSEGGAGKLTGELNELFSSIPEDEKGEMIRILDEYTRYLESINADTTKRLQETLDGARRKSKNPILSKILKTDKEKEGKSLGESPINGNLVSHLSQMDIGKRTNLPVDVEIGPGGYLVKWKDLMDRQKATIKGMGGIENGAGIHKIGGIERPDTRSIEARLGAKFREILGVRSKL